MNTSIESTPPWRRSMSHSLEKLREGWPDAARIVASAMLAYTMAYLLRLHEIHWAVLSALVTARGHAGGTARAGVERLLATVAGAALATAGAYARHSLAIPDAVVLFSVLIPLSLLVAVRPSFRTALIAALIVLSSGPAAGMGALGTALVRTAEIAIGSIASVLVSLAVFPKHGKFKARMHAAATLRLIAQWLNTVFSAEAAAESESEHLRERIREELRELTILAHTSGWRKMQDRQLARLLKMTSALNVDAGFIVRAVARRPLQAVVTELRGALNQAVQPLLLAIEQTASALTANAPPPDRGAIETALKNLSLAGRDAAERVELRHTQTLIYLLRMLSVDLDNFASVLPPGEGLNVRQRVEEGADEGRNSQDEVER